MAIMDRGSVVLPGRPGDALDEVRGRIWRKRVSRESVQRYRDDFPVSSVRLVGGEPVVHVSGEAEPEEGFSAWIRCWRTCTTGCAWRGDVYS
jgi:ABC-2 type transport system ATP-binding protein